MQVNSFVIGIETEGYWNGKAGSKLPPNYADHRIFAQALVPWYNQIGKSVLRADFSHGSHPGHHEDSNNQSKWIVALDHGIGDLDLNVAVPEGRRYQTTLSAAFTICISLITIQIPLNLSPQN